jgi:glycine/D-amino acid oxidase-like deaminating enzyme
VVIGAGVLGAAVAARLAGEGVRVTLLDQDHPGRATSRWSFAWLNSVRTAAGATLEADAARRASPLPTRSLRHPAPDTTACSDP